MKRKCRIKKETINRLTKAMKMPTFYQEGPVHRATVNSIDVGKKR